MSNLIDKKKIQSNSKDVCSNIIRELFLRVHRIFMTRIHSEGDSRQHLKNKIQKDNFVHHDINYFDGDFLTNYFRQFRFRILSKKNISFFFPESVQHFHGEYILHNFLKSLA